ncbi:MAG: pilin [Patescibacteria group bacterium]
MKSKSQLLSESEGFANKQTVRIWRTPLKQALLVFALMVGALSLLSVLPVAGAAILNPTDNPEAVAGATGGETTLRGLILTIVNYFLGFLGLLAVIMVIYGGVTYVYSAGNDEAIGKAKKIIMYALIGIVIILLSFVLVRMVLGSGTGTE